VEGTPLSFKSGLKDESFRINNKKNFVPVKVIATPTTAFRVIMLLILSELYNNTIYDIFAAGESKLRIDPPSCSFEADLDSGWTILWLKCNLHRFRFAAG